jgi:hypothetical protein
MQVGKYDALQFTLIYDCTCGFTHGRPIHHHYNYSECSWTNRLMYAYMVDYLISTRRAS